MILKKKNRFKPLYKQFLNLGNNVQNRRKLLKFKKQKWSKLLFHLKKKMKWYNKFKPQDQTRYLVSRFPNRWDSYKKGSFRNTLKAYKTLNLFYGGFAKKHIKKFITQTYNKTSKTKKLGLIFLKIFESRLDTVLYRSKFTISIKAARQLIVHGKIFVNNMKIKSPLYILKPGDLITIDYKISSVIEKGIARSNTWPITPKHLVVNYKTLQIIFGTLEYAILSSYYSINFNIEKILVDYRYK
jgi:ribosomal protein S4